MNKEKMVKTIPFNREHLNIMSMREYEKECLYPYLSDIFLTSAEESPECHTMLIEDRVITCFGGFPLWPGVYEIWQIPSIYVADHVRAYCETLTGVLDESAERLGIWRMQSTCPADELHDRWMRFLGFKSEGTFEKYSRFKVDHRMWAKGYNHGC